VSPRCFDSRQAEFRSRGDKLASDGIRATRRKVGIGCRGPEVALGEASDGGLSGRRATRTKLGFGRRGPKGSFAEIVLVAGALPGTLVTGANAVWGPCIRSPHIREVNRLIFIGGASRLAAIFTEP